MKTLNFKLSKKLNELGLLDNIDTECFYYKPIKTENIYKIGPNTFVKNFEEGDIKTLTLEEAIEFLPCRKFIEGVSYHFTIGKGPAYYICYERDGKMEYINHGKTLIKAVENIITYLLDNHLLK